MDITYLGHSCFKIRSKTGTAVTDPYSSKVGFSMPSVSADIVTVSHDHFDHNYVKGVSGTSRRNEPFVIRDPGEYEVEGISVFGYQAYHDGKEGEERGENNIYVIQAEGVRALHLGDLGHELSEKMVEELDGIDVLMIPIGGIYTIDVKQALEVMEQISPSIVIPMHYKTKDHKKDSFEKLADLEAFVSAYGSEVRKVEDKLTVNRISVSDDTTEVVVF